MCTGIRVQTCPDCKQCGSDHAPYLQEHRQIIPCAESSVPVPGIKRLATKCPGIIFRDDHALSRGSCAECLLKANQIAEREAEYVQQQNRRSDAKKTLKAAKNAWKATAPAKQILERIPKETAKKTPKKTRGAVEKKTSKRTKKRTNQAAAEALISMSDHHQK